MPLPLQKKVVLGLQHTVAMFGATVLVPLLTGLNPSVALFGAGLATMIVGLGLAVTHAFLKPLAQPATE